VSKCKNQGLGKTTAMLGMGVILSTTPLIAMDNDDLEIRKAVKLNVHDTKKEREEKEKRIIQQKLYDQEAQENYNAAQTLSDTFKREGKNGSFETFDKEANKLDLLAIKADSQEKAREAAEKTALNEKADNLELKHRIIPAP
jgi:hypothetical protein